MKNLFSWQFILLLLFIFSVLSFLLSASETSIIGLSKIRLRHMLKRGVKRSQSLQRLISKMDRFIIAILVMNNFTSITISAIITGVCVVFLGFKIGTLVATFLAAFYILIFCEITPKIMAIKHTEKVALMISPVMEVLIKLFAPVIAFFEWASNIIIKILRIKPAKRSPLITEEELRLMIELGREEGFLSDDEGRMLQSIFEFGDMKVADVMVPKDKMTAVNINTSAEELLNIFVEQGHSRLPVYKDSTDSIVGIIYAHDLLYILRDKGLFVLHDLVHEAHFVQPKTPVAEVLKRFQQDRIQIAIVSDERKRALGLVTLEDLIEEIVGEVGEKQTRRAKK